MANVACLDDEDHVLGDVGRMVANALEMAGHQDQIDAGLDDLRIAQHVGHELAHNLIVQHVEPVILAKHAVSGGGVARHERGQRLAQHGERQVAHPWKIDERLDRRVRQVSLSRFSQIDCQISHAFQVGVDPQRRHDHSQIDGHGLEERQQLKTVVVNLDLRLIQAIVSGDDIVQRVAIALHQSLKGESHAMLSHLTHRGDPVLQQSKFIAEVR